MLPISTILLLSGAVLLTQQSARAQQKNQSVCSDLLGSQQVELQSDHRSLLDVLFSVGSTENICIAFEGANHRVFDSKIHLTKLTGTVSEVIGQALRENPDYCMTQEGRVLRVARCSNPNETWLDYRIKSISWHRNFLQAISNGLFLSLSNQVTPSSASFGHFRSGVINDEIGPYDLKNQTVRALLNRFVQDSTGAFWFTYKPFDRQIGSPEKDTVQHFWSILEYKDNPRQLHSNLQLLRETAAQEFVTH